MVKIDSDFRINIFAGDCFKQPKKRLLQFWKSQTAFFTEIAVRGKMGALGLLFRSGAWEFKVKRQRFCHETMVFGNRPQGNHFRGHFHDSKSCVKSCSLAASRHQVGK